MIVIKKITFLIFFIFIILVEQKGFTQGIEITTGASIKAIGNSTIEIKDGNFINNGTYTMGTENLIFSGTSNGIISGLSNNDFYHLTINNSNGVTHSSTGYVAINNLLTFSNGLFNTGNNYLIINDNVTYTGSSTTRYINGNCRKVGNDAFIFPIGNNGKYARIAIAAPVNLTDHFTATYYNQNPNPLYNVTLIGIGVNHVSTLEYWTLNRTNGTSNVAVSLYWDATSIINTITDLRVVKWDGTMWVNEGNTNTSGNTTLGNITSEIITNFSPFTIASSTINNPLPVELVSFEVQCVNGANLLSWTTASEINCDYFLVEKMNEKKKFIVIGRINGNGNSQQTSNYQFKDNNSNSIDYYRLTQVDYNGDVHIYNHKIAVSTCDNSNFQLNLNSSINTLNIIVNTNVENAIIKIYDLSGRVVLNTLISLNYGTNKINLSTYNLSFGMYVVNIQAKQENKSTKLILR